MKTKRTFRRILPFLLLVLGLAILFYPMFSDWYYTIEANQQIVSFTKEASTLSNEEINRRLELAHNYNHTLDPSRLADPYTKKEKEGIANYAHMLEVQEMIGHIIIPSIEVDLPVRAGSSPQVLEDGAGHLEGTSLPVGGESTHAVITAHRGLPKAVMFRYLDKLHEGDLFFFKNFHETLAYEVDQILTVEPSNFEPVLVVEGEDYMTLLTCTPYMINSHRLLVRGHRVPYEDAIPEPTIRMEIPTTFWKRGFYACLFVAIALLIYLLYLLLEQRKQKQEE